MSGQALVQELELVLVQVSEQARVQELELALVQVSEQARVQELERRELEWARMQWLLRS